jgi:hypothetical protein
MDMDHFSLTPNNDTVDPTTALQLVFGTVLEHIYGTGWGGACHSSSAMLNILLKEHGVDSEIMIGEVFCDGYRFDHSWVVAMGQIFDAAVALPQAGGIKLGGPVFAGFDIETHEPTRLKHGVGLPGGLGSDEQLIASQTIGEYFAYADELNRDDADFNDQPTPIALWDRVSLVGSVCGVFKTPAQLLESHSQTGRTVVSHELFRF